MTTDPRADWFDDPDYQALEARLFENFDDSWDDDASSIAILEDCVGHACDEVKRLGGCLRRYCRWNDNEPCDHGYLGEPIAPHENNVSILRDRESALRSALAALVEACETTKSGRNYIVARAAVGAACVLLGDGRE